MLNAEIKLLFFPRKSHSSRTVGAPESASTPPATSTRPSVRSVAVWKALGVGDVAVSGSSLPDTGSNTSEDATIFLSCPIPPKMSTVPFGSTVAVWAARGNLRPELTTETAPVSGSTVERVPNMCPLALSPPEIRSLPSGSNVLADPTRTGKSLEDESGDFRIFPNAAETKTVDVIRNRTISDRKRNFRNILVLPFNKSKSRFSFASFLSS
jgi:hypothetical protein